MKRPKQFLLWPVILCLTMLLPTPVAANGVTVSIDVPDEVAAGSNFSAGVNITEVTAFCAHQFEISYNASVIEVTDVTDGLIGSIAVDVAWEYVPLGTPGKILVIGDLPTEYTYSGINGTGYLAEIHFHAVGSPCNTSNMTFLDVRVFNNLGGRIIVDDWVDDSVHICEALVVTCDADIELTNVDHPVNFTCSPGGGVPGYTYSWDFGDGVGTSGLQNPSYAYSGAGNYSACVNVTDAAENTAQCCVNITVNPALEVSCNATSGVAELGEAVNFTCSPGGGVPGYTYSWDFGDGVGTSGLQNPGYTYTDAGNYTACVNVTDSLGNDVGCCVTITICMPGDADGDGDVDVGDVIVVKRIILGLDPPTPCADVNGDGVVDMGDVIKIKRIILGLD